MDVANLLLGTAVGAAEGWIQGQAMENQQKAEEAELRRQEQLLMKREEIQNRYTKLGVREDGSIVFASDYSPGEKVYEEAPGTRRADMKSEIGKKYQDLLSMGYSEEEAQRLAMEDNGGKKDMRDLGTLYTDGQNTYTEQQLSGMQQLPSGLYKVGDKPKAGDDTDKRELWTDVYTKALEGKIEVTPEDELAAQQLADRVSGLQLSGTQSTQSSGEYPEANPGITPFTSNKKETAQLVAVDLMDGVDQQEIKKKLVKAGWKNKDIADLIDTAVKEFGVDQQEQVKPEPQKVQKQAGKSAMDIINGNPQYKKVFLSASKEDQQRMIQQVQERLNRR